MTGARPDRAWVDRHVLELLLEAAMGEDPGWLKSLEQARLDKQNTSYIRYDNFREVEREFERQVAELRAEVERLRADLRRLTQIGVRAEVERDALLETGDDILRLVQAEHSATCAERWGQVTEGLKRRME